MIYQTCDAMVNISTWNRVHFWIYLLNSPSLSHQTRPIQRHKQGQQSSWVFWTIWRTGASFQVLFNLATCPNYSITKFVMIRGFHFLWKGEQRTSKNDKCQTLKMARSRYIVFLMKSRKGLELVSSPQYWTKNMLEMFRIQDNSIWPNFILIVLTIQKK